MREATAMEYGEARSRPYVEIRYSFGKRYTTVHVSYLGKLIAIKDDYLKRGKVVSTAYSVCIER